MALHNSEGLIYHKTQSTVLRNGSESKVNRVETSTLSPFSELESHQQMNFRKQEIN